MWILTIMINLLILIALGSLSHGNRIQGRRGSFKERNVVPDFKDVNNVIYDNNDVQLPSFLSNVENQTVIAGRSAVLKCSVKNLGNYKVAWVRVDTQTILTIHTNIITRNQRVSLSQHDNKQWRLHLNNVQESDKGWYMCQINTDPMRSERGYLKVVVPPKIIDSRTSPDIIVKEGNSVNMTCDALGSPEPRIMWKREDNQMIKYDAGEANSVNGNWFSITSVSRTHIGAYFCIASNNVPPSVSKRIELKVQFAPMVRVENQLELAYVSQTNISLSCTSESFPPAIHYWKFRNGSALIRGPKYMMRSNPKSYITTVTLTITNIRSNDFGTYLCVAKNSLGESDGAIKLSEREAPPVLYTNPPPLSPPDDFNQISETDKELFGKKYNYRFEDENRKNIRWRENGRGKNSFDANQLNTYSPFFQNEDSDDIDKDDAMLEEDGRQNSERDRKENKSHSNHIYHINNGSNCCRFGASIMILLLLCIVIIPTSSLNSPLARSSFLISIPGLSYIRFRYEN